MKGTHRSQGLTRPWDLLPSPSHKAKGTVRHHCCRSSVTPSSDELGVTFLADSMDPLSDKPWAVAGPGLSPAVLGLRVARTPRDPRSRGARLYA